MVTAASLPVRPILQPYVRSILKSVLSPVKQWTTTFCGSIFAFLKTAIASAYAPNFSFAGSST